jgi:hypothetical protein
MRGVLRSAGTRAEDCLRYGSLHLPAQEADAPSSGLRPPSVLPETWVTGKPETWVTLRRLKNRAIIDYWGSDCWGLLIIRFFLGSLAAGLW